MQAQGDNSAKAGSKAIREILDEVPLRAASFIVTIYGDVVEPRGGAIWIGNLIEICAGVGISETLVRTAVSRLVAAGRLAGEREGRRSFYRLTDAARTEFAGAARVIFGLPEEASWHFVQLMGSSAEDRMLMLERSGHARLSPRLAIGVRPFPTAIMPALVFRAEIAEGAEELKAFASASWDLAPHAEAYRRFLGSFQSLAAPADAGSMTPADCLTARLLLVHQFRFVALRDPRLPAETLPEAGRVTRPAGCSPGSTSIFLIRLTCMRRSTSLRLRGRWQPPRERPRNGFGCCGGKVFPRAAVNPFDLLLWHPPAFNVTKNRDSVVEL